MAKAFHLFASILVAFLAQQAAAEESSYSDENFEAPDVYQIEFVLFKHAEPELDILEFEQVMNAYQRPETYAVLYPYSVTSPSTRSRPALPSEAELTLERAVRRLSSSNQFEVLLSGEWQQEIANDSETLPVLIQVPQPVKSPFFLDQRIKENVPANVERFLGHIQIKRSRYMHAHVRVDYQFLQPFAYKNLQDWFVASPSSRLFLGDLLYPLSTSRNDEDDNAELVSEGADSAMQIYKSFSLQQSRRIRDAEVHYIDHPYLGMVVSIKKLETEGF